MPEFGDITVTSSENPEKVDTEFEKIGAVVAAEAFVKERMQKGDPTAEWTVKQRKSGSLLLAIVWDKEDADEDGENWSRAQAVGVEYSSGGEVLIACPQQPTSEQPVQWGVWKPTKKKGGIIQFDGSNQEQISQTITEVAQNIQESGLKIESRYKYI